MQEINLLSEKKDNMADILDSLTEDVVANLTDSQKINIQMLQNLTSLNTRMNDLTHDVTEHNKILVTGNGEPSLQERIRNLEEFTQSIKYWERFVGGAIILQAVAFMVALILALIKFLPLLEKLSAQVK